MDFKEVKKKDGTTLVFCNFEELLMEAYNVGSMKEVEAFANSNDEYICHCPFCKKEGHTKHKLYIRTDLTVGHCFVCCRNYVNVSNSVEVTFKVPDFLDMFGGYQGFNLVKLSDPVWTLDKYKYEFDDFDPVGYNYLLGRHKYMKDLYKILGFKFMNGNIVMPFKYHGEIFYYQIRFSGNSSIRYFFPPISKKPPYIIERAGNNKKIAVCEGIFDAIALLIMAPEYTPCAVLGSSISDYQIEFIREYIPNEILVYMDETSISKGIVNKLRSVIDYCPINIIPSNGQDPEEKMKELMIYNKNLQWIKSKYTK